jgi:hypothetical protein
MADWWGFSRSNYFRVKDRELFLNWAKEIDDLDVLHAKDGVVAITGQFYGGWPHVRGEDPGKQRQGTASGLRHYAPRRKW